MKRLLNIVFLISIAANASALQWDGYKRVGVMTVSADVLRAVSDNYTGYAVMEAYLSEEGQNEYRLMLLKSKKPLVVYYKSTGEFIKEKVK